MDTNLLEVFNYFDKKIELSRLQDKPTLKHVVNKVFLQKDIFFYLNSKLDSNFSFEIYSRSNFDDINFNNLDFDTKNTLQYFYNYSYINNSNNSYAQKKLVKIIVEKIAILKQRQSIDKILLILT